MAESVTIGSMVYEIIADQEQFEKSMDLTNRDLKEAQRLFRQAKTPVEKYGEEVDRLNDLRRRGAIDAQTYRRSLERAEQAYRKATSAADRLGNEQRELNELGKRASGIFDSMGKRMLGAVTGALSLEGAIRGIAQEFAAVDEIIKTGRRLGIATDQLIGLRIAGEQLAGMADSTVDMAMQRMTRRISEAADAASGSQQSMEGMSDGMTEVVSGATGVAKAIQELGLSAEELNSMTPDQAFRRIADAIQAIDNESDQLRIAFKLFDSEGAAMVNVLKAGGDEIDEFVAKAARLGLTIGDEAAPGIENVNDAVSDLRLEFQGLKRDIVELTAEPLADWFANTRKRNEEAQSAMRSFFDTISGGMLTERALEEAVERTNRELAEQLEIVEETQGGEGMMGGLFNIADREATNAIDETASALRGLWDAAAEATQADKWQEWADAGVQAANEVQTAQAKADREAAEQRKQNRLQEQQALEQQFLQIRQRNETDAERFKRQVDELKRLRFQGLDQQTFDREMQRLLDERDRDQIREQQDADKQRQEFEQLQPELARAGSEAEFRLLNEIRSGEKAKADEQIDATQQAGNMVAAAVKAVENAVAAQTRIVARQQPIIGIP